METRNIQSQGTDASQTRMKQEHQEFCRAGKNTSNGTEDVVVSGKNAPLRLFAESEGLA